MEMQGQGQGQGSTSSFQLMTMTDCGITVSHYGRKIRHPVIRFKIMFLNKKTQFLQWLFRGHDYC